MLSCQSQRLAQFAHPYAFERINIPHSADFSNESRHFSSLKPKDFSTVFFPIQTYAISPASHRHIRPSSARLAKPVQISLQFILVKSEVSLHLIYLGIHQETVPETL